MYKVGQIVIAHTSQIYGSSIGIIVEDWTHESVIVGSYYHDAYVSLDGLYQVPGDFDFENIVNRKMLKLPCIK
jgi:hypothetical protein